MMNRARGKQKSNTQRPTARVMKCPVIERDEQGRLREQKLRGVISNLTDAQIDRLLRLAEAF